MFHFPFPLPLIGNWVLSVICPLISPYSPPILVQLSSLSRISKNICFISFLTFGFLMCMCAFVLSCVWFFVTLCTEGRHTTLPVEFSRQEYWNKSPFPPPGDLPDPGIEPSSFVASPALTGGFFTTVPPGKPSVFLAISQIWSGCSLRKSFLFYSIECTIESILSMAYNACHNLTLVSCLTSFLSLLIAHFKIQ